MNQQVKRVFRTKTHGIKETKYNLMYAAKMPRAGYFRVKETAGYKCACGQTAGYEILIGNRQGTEFYSQTFGVCRVCGED